MFVCEWIRVCTSSLDFHLLRLSFPSTRYSSFVSLSLEHFRCTWPPSPAQDRYFSPPAHLTSFPIHLFSLIPSASPLFLFMPLLKCQAVCISVALCPVKVRQLWSSTHALHCLGLVMLFSPFLLSFKISWRHFVENIHWLYFESRQLTFTGFFFGLSLSCCALICTHTAECTSGFDLWPYLFLFLLCFKRCWSWSFFFSSWKFHIFQLFKVRKYFMLTYNQLTITY